MASAVDQALLRKERLRALREQRDRNEEQGGESAKPQLKFRSYNPLTEALKEKKLPKGRPEEVAPQIQAQLEDAKETSLGEVNLASLAPRKVDWDLKRDISKKLEKLERRTQRAIVELIRERLQDDSNELAAAVATAGQHNQDVYD